MVWGGGSVPRRRARSGRTFWRVKGPERRRMTIPGLLPGSGSIFKETSGDMFGSVYGTEVDLSLENDGCAEMGALNRNDALRPVR